MSKPKNPYIALKSDFSDWMFRAITRERIPMWHYQCDVLAQGWTLTELHSRVMAAQQLGWTVELRASKDGLMVEYVAPMPKTPWWY